MTQLLAIAHVIKIILIGICIITAYYWIKTFITALRCDSVIDRFGKRFGDEFLKAVENTQTLGNIDDNKIVLYEVDNALYLYKLLVHEKSDHIWTPDDISHLAAEAFEIKLLCEYDEDADKNNERGRQIKIILDNLDNLYDIVDKCNKYINDTASQFYWCPKAIYMNKKLDFIEYKKYLSGGSKLCLEIQEEKQKELDEQNKNNQKKKRK